MKVRSILKYSYILIICLYLLGITQANAQITVEHYELTGDGVLDGQSASIRLVGTTESFSYYDLDANRVNAQEYKYSGTISNAMNSIGINFSGTQLDKYLRGSLHSSPPTNIHVAVTMDNYTQTSILQIFIWNQDYTRTFELGRFRVVSRKTK